MVRIASAMFVLLAISISVLPLTLAVAGPYDRSRGGAVYIPRGGVPVFDRYPYRRGYHRSYRSAAWYGLRYYGSYRPAVMPLYFVNGCYNGYSDHGVYCHVLEGCPFGGYPH